MSRATNVEITNPAEKFLKWSGSKGNFEYWDKSKGENGEKVEITLPVKFLILDTLSTCKGYSDKDSSGIWSNEVRDTNTDIMIAHTSKGVIGRGLYKELKADPKCTGLKFSQSVYIALIEGKTMSLCNIQFTGAALNSWIDFKKEKGNLYDGGIEVANSTTGKKGATVYKIPTFTKFKVDETVDTKAKELDGILQEYLNLYFKRNSEQSN